MVGERHPLVSYVVPGGMGSDELISWESFIAAQQGGGKKPESTESEPTNRSPLVDKLRSMENWFKKFLPQDPTEIMVPRELMAQLDIALDKANRTQRTSYEGEFDYSRQVQCTDHSTARQLFLDSGLNKVYDLKPGISGLAYQEKRRFEGRVEAPPSIRGDYAVFKVNPPLK